MSSNKNSQIRGTSLGCFQIGKILKLGALPLFNLKWKDFLNQRHSPCLFSVNTLNSLSPIMHILWLSLRIQSHNAQSKTERLFTWIKWLWSFLIKRMVWVSNVIISQKTYSKGLPFAHLKKEKMILFKTDKNTTL